MRAGGRCAAAASGMALGIGASAVVVLLSFLLIRSVAVKPKKV